jgi:uncharacterized OsmC-like protein/pimeloyl-ACP methyl ester carboxylesterase
MLSLVHKLALWQTADAHRLQVEQHMPKMQFTNRDGRKLAGTMELPPGGAWQATALFAHCFTCTRNIRAARDITRELAAAGFAVLRFDFTGLGESEGEFSGTNFASNLDDLEDAARHLAVGYAAPQLLVGHSLGGTAAVAVAERIESVRAVVTLGSPASPEHVLKQFGDDLERIESEGSANVELAGRSFSIRRDFIEDARGHDLAARLRGLRRALLIMHSPADTIVPIDQAEKLFGPALHPKSFVSLGKADHMLSRAEDSRYAGNMIATWASRFLEIDSTESAEGVTTSGLTAQGFLCGVQAGQHRFIADEPEQSGGKDLGPDPYEFLAAALGACTVMTLNMYARHKRLALERVSCTVKHQRVHAKDCEECVDRDRRIDKFSRTLRLEGELQDNERQRLLEIAERCPVHRTLEGEIEIDTSLA